MNAPAAETPGGSANATLTVVEQRQSFRVRRRRHAVPELRQSPASAPRGGTSSSASGPRREGWGKRLGPRVPLIDSGRVGLPYRTRTQPRPSPSGLRGSPRLAAVGAPATKGSGSRGGCYVPRKNESHYGVQRRNPQLAKRRLLMVHQLNSAIAALRQSAMDAGSRASNSNSI
jgi:hypothetical protein